MPLLASGLDIVSGLVRETGGRGELRIEDVLSITDGDALLNAFIHLSGFEFVEFLYITWAMAKEADDSIPEPKTWIRQFDEFPVDVIAPKVVSLIFKGMCSSKNLERLREIKENMTTPQPKQ